MRLPGEGRDSISGTCLCDAENWAPACAGATVHCLPATRRMKLNDAVWGGFFLLLATAILVHVQSFPNIPGQKVGPALFPGLIAVALAVCALILIAKGLSVRRKDAESLHWFSPGPWLGSRRHVLAFTLAIGVNVFYILLVDKLRFILAGVIYLSALFAVFGVRPRTVVPVALIVTLAIHFGFYKLLKVPLPWGILSGVAW